MKREKAIEILNALAWVQGGADREEIITAISMAIEALSTEAVQGKWIKEKTDDNNDTWYRCSNCAERFVLIDNNKASTKPYNFCPNCRADMREGNK